MRPPRCRISRRRDEYDNLQRQERQGFFKSLPHYESLALLIIWRSERPAINGALVSQSGLAASLAEQLLFIHIAQTGFDIILFDLRAFLA